MFEIVKKIAYNSANFMPYAEEYENEWLSVKVQLCGFRRFLPLNIVPYFTRSRPELRICITLKDLGYQIEHVSIGHTYEQPTIISSEYQSPNWASGEERRIKFGRLYPSGKHSYDLSIILRIPSQEYPIYTGNTILKTEQVFDRSQVFFTISLMILAALIGAGAATLFGD